MSHYVAARGGACREPAELLIADLRRRGPPLVRLDAPSYPRPPAAIAHLGFEARDATGDEGRAERGALRDGDDIDRQARARSQGVEPRLDPGTAATPTLSIKFLTNCVSSWYLNPEISVIT